MRTLLALLVAASPASALGPAAWPSLPSVSMTRLRMAAAGAPGVGAAAVLGTQSSWQDLVRFSDGPNPLPYARGIVNKPWTPAERQLLLSHFDWIVRTYPGLWARATAAGPITLFRSQKSGSMLILTLYTTMTFMDSGMVDGAPAPADQNSVRFNLVHELSHVADIESAVSSTPGWRAAVERPLKDYNSQASGLGSADRTALAVRLGLGSAYAGRNQLEALAEMTAFAAMEPLMSPADFAALRLSPDALDFVRREMLGAPSGGPGLAADLAGGAAARDAGRYADAYAAYSRALQTDPQALVALIRRAESSLRDPSLPATAGADLAAARPLLFDHHNHAMVFYELAVEQEAKAGRYDDALQDCSTAYGKRIETGPLLYNCAQARTMGTMTRAMRRQVTPEERDRGYAQALDEVRRARAAAPYLGPRLDALERQLQGLLAPKPPAS